MLQVEFNRFYDELRRYSLYKAKQYFSDVVLCQDAADRAVDDFIDAYIKDKDVKNLQGWARDIIVKSIRKQSRRRKLEPIALGEGFEGMHGYRVI